MVVTRWGVKLWRYTSAVPVTQAVGQGQGSSILHALRILCSFTVEEPLLGVTEIADRVGMHKSSVSRILSVLASEDFVEKDPETGRYRLGMSVIGMAGPLLANLDVRRVSMESMRSLRDATNETVALETWNGSESVVVEQVPSHRNVKHTAVIGTRYAGVESSSVRVFLAYAAEGVAKGFLDSYHLDASTDAMNHAPGERIMAEAEMTQSRRQRIESDLTAIKGRGYALNLGETSPDEVGVSAPVFDIHDTVAGVITLSAPSYRTDEARLAWLVEHVVTTARDISQRMGSGITAEGCRR